MNSKRIKKELEISLTKRSLQGKLYYTVENQIASIQEKKDFCQTSRKLTKVGICSNQIGATIVEKELKFPLKIKTFTNYTNLNKHLNKTLSTKNVNPSIIKIDNVLFKTKNIVSTYLFEWNNIFCVVKNISNKNTNLLLLLKNIEIIRNTFI